MYLKKGHQKNYSYASNTQQATTRDDTVIDNQQDIINQERIPIQSKQNMKFRVQRSTVMQGNLGQASVKSVMAINKAPKNIPIGQQQRTYKSSAYKGIQSVSRTAYNNFNDYSPSQIKTQISETNQQAKRISSSQKKTSVKVGYSDVEYRTVKNAHFDDNSEFLKQFVPDVEEKRNKKNDSNVQFDAQYKRNNNSRLKKAYKEFVQVGPQHTQYRRIAAKKVHQEKSRLFDIMLENAKQTLIEKLQVKDNELKQQYQQQGRTSPLKDWSQALSLRSQIAQSSNIPFVAQKQEQQDLYIIGTYNSDLENSPQNNNKFEPKFQQVNQSYDGAQLYGSEDVNSVRKVRRQNDVRPRSSIIKPKRIKSIRQIEEEFRRESQALQQKLKSQNYHISGNDHQMVYKPYNTAQVSATQTPRDQRSTTPSTKQLMYRTSFQECFQRKQVDSHFKDDVKRIHDRMKKNSIPLKQNEANLQLLLEISNQVGKDAEVSAANYDNVNLVNHIPFADKKRKDILSNKQRFKSCYRSYHSKSPDKEMLFRTFKDNNILNSQYKSNVLKEHFDLGRKSDADGKLILTSEVRSNYIRTKEHSSSIKREIYEGKAPFQLREENKELIERQNFSIKQPIVSGGDILDVSRTETKLNYPFQTYVEINGSVRSTTNAKDFKQLNYKDQMMNQRKTNFHFGSPSPQSRKSGFLSIEFNNTQRMTRQSTIGHMLQLVEDKKTFDIRPMTSNVNNQMRKNKFESENTKIVLGNEKIIQPSMSKTNYHFYKANNTSL